MTKLHRYIDDPMSFFFWDVDEIAVFSCFLVMGLLTNLLTAIMPIGLVLCFVLSKIKQSRAEGFFMHILYWYGIYWLKGCPPSWVRELHE